MIWGLDAVPFYLFFHDRYGDSLRGTWSAKDTGKRTAIWFNEARGLSIKRDLPSKIDWNRMPSCDLLFSLHNAPHKQLPQTL